ncbi:MAG: hypothetical protein AAGA48_14785 [Myxococcota bacterium]
MHRFALLAAVFVVACEGDDTGTGDTAETTVVTPDPIAVTGLNVACNADGTEVTFTATTTGMFDEALLNSEDYANIPNSFIEEHNFEFTDGNIDPLTLAVNEADPGTPGFVPGTNTIFTCPAHFVMDSAVMSYAVRVYSEGTLAACNVASENDAAEAFIKDAGGQSAVPTNVTTPEDFDSCGTDLALTY